MPLRSCSAFAWFCIILLAPLAGLAQDSAAPAPGAKAPSLIEEAFNKWMNDQGRWSFTETQRSTGFNQKPSGDTIRLVDPSQPYTEQYKLIKLNGKEPPAKSIESSKRRGEQVAKSRKEAEIDAKEHTGDEIKIFLGGEAVMPDLKHAKVLSEDANSISYDVPMHKTVKNADVLFDEFQLTVRVNKQRHEFERAVFHQRTAMRQGMAKLTDSEMEVEFTSVDPRYPSVITRQTQRASVGVLFIKRRITAEDTYTDLVHVTPFDERFGVKLGPIRTIQF